MTDFITRREGPDTRPEPLEKAVCTDGESCNGCPYPSHGFVCWSSSDNCIRKEVERMNAMSGRSVTT